MAIREDLAKNYLSPATAREIRLEALKLAVTSSNTERKAFYLEDHAANIVQAAQRYEKYILDGNE